MEVGIDEVGRGALAGPLIVGAVVVPEDFDLTEMLLVAKLPALRDSKKMTRLQRERAFSYLEGRIIWELGAAEPEEIDRLGLRKAADLACDRALDALVGQGVTPTSVRADAGLFHSRETEWSTERFIQGDERFIEITFASIMAKVSRDRMMRALALPNSIYGWETNVGYGSALHYEAINKYGITPMHRKLFLRKMTISP